MQQTIEQKVAQTVLQETFPVRVGTKEYAVRPITYGTLIRVSAVVSTLPPVGEDERALVRQFSDGYTRHIALEEALAYPAARPLFSPHDLRRIGAEMAARRRG